MYVCVHVYLGLHLLCVNFFTILPQCRCPWGKEDCLLWPWSGDCELIHVLDQLRAVACASSFQCIPPPPPPPPPCTCRMTQLRAPCIHFSCLPPTSRISLLWMARYSCLSYIFLWQSAFGWHGYCCHGYCVMLSLRFTRQWTRSTTSSFRGSSSLALLRTLRQALHCTHSLVASWWN